MFRSSVDDTAVLYNYGDGVDNSPTVLCSYLSSAWQRVCLIMSSFSRYTFYSQLSNRTYVAWLMIPRIVNNNKYIQFITDPAEETCFYEFMHYVRRSMLVLQVVKNFDEFHHCDFQPFFTF